jgi:5'-nucleotidase
MRLHTVSTTSRTLKGLLAATAMTAGLTGVAYAQSAGNYTLTILHVNDLHSRLQQTNATGSSCSDKDAAEKKCFGGMARIVAKSKEIKAEIAAKKGNLLFVHGGDQFQGTLFFTHYKGKADQEIVNRFGLDAATLGNHEFDNGPAVLAEYLTGVNFPVVTANIDLSGEPKLKGLVQPYIIVERGGEKIGIIGGITMDTPITSSPGPTVKFLDDITSIQKYVNEIKLLGVNKIIAVTHIGLVRETQIAEAVTGLDVIAGGHSHSLLSNTAKDAVAPAPVVVNKKDGSKTLLVQAGEYTKYLGRLDVTFNGKGEVASWNGEPILLDASVAEDKETADRIAALDKPIQEMKNRPVGEAKAAIDGDRKNCRQKECTMGNLVSDALLSATKAKGTQIVIMNGGGLRTSIDQGPVTLGEVLTVLPFQNTIATMKLKGSDVVAALENGFSKVEEEQGRFPQVAGLRVTWDRKKPPMSRVVSVEVADGATFKPIDPNAIYNVGTNDFMRRGGDGFSVFKDKSIDAYDFGPNLEDTVASYIGANSPYEPKLEGRIKEVQ